MYEPVALDVEQLVTKVMDAAFIVHRTLGPGLLESVYETCLCHELNKLNIPFERQLVLPIVYDNIKINSGLKLDLLVGNKLICELKAVDKIMPIHEAQLLTYLKLTDLRLGLILNFNVKLFKDGFRRIIR